MNNAQCCCFLCIKCLNAVCVGSALVSELVCVLQCVSSVVTLEKQTEVEHLRKIPFGPEQNQHHASVSCALDDRCLLKEHADFL